MTLAELAVLRDGFTMADIDRLAKVAARRHDAAADYSDRYEAAWYGIVNALYSADTQVTERDLLWEGVRAIRENRAERNQAHGRSSRHDYEYGSAPSFGKFWNAQQVEPSHEGRIIETVALTQALATLTGDQYDALAAAAVCDNLGEAADALGITYHQFIRRYYAARDAIRALWFEGETPRLALVGDDRCRSGHPRSQHTRTKENGKRYCQECQRLAKQRRRARGAA